MSECVESGERKIDILRKSLDWKLGEREIAIAFSSSCQMLKSLAAIPEPQGSTAMHLALQKSQLYNPRHALIISDGIPDDQIAAISAAEQLSGVISTLYIGLDSNKEAIAFMKKLARLGCGSANVCDISKPSDRSKLSTNIYLSLPARN